MDKCEFIMIKSGTLEQVTCNRDVEYRVSINGGRSFIGMCEKHYKDMKKNTKGIPVLGLQIYREETHGY